MAIKVTAHSLHLLFKCRDGSVSLITSIAMLPMVIMIGVAVDCSMLVNYRTQLQDAVDQAALSGALMYSSSDAEQIGISAAKNSLTNYSFGQNVSLSSNPIIKTGTTKGPAGLTNSYTVTVTATAHANLSILSFISGLQDITASASAKNPYVFVTITPSQVPMNTTALDQNSVFAYPVQMSGGYPIYDAIPYDLGSSSAPEIMDNCWLAVKAATAAHTGTPACASGVPNAEGGDWQPTSSPPTLRVVSNGPIAFVLKNVTGFLAPDAESSYQQNGYGSPWGNVNIFSTSALIESLPADAFTSSISSTTIESYGYPQHYQYPAGGPPDTKYSYEENCNLQVTVGDTTQSLPPYSDKCFASTTQGTVISGYRLAIPTCAQMSQKPLTFYWNDMGGGKDDYDYNDAVYSIQCSRINNRNSIETVLYK